jgi:FADH2 O2-dependent halogenase
MIFATYPQDLPAACGLQEDAMRTWDVAVLGGGIAGCALAAVLARQGVSVLVCEAGQHPRFAVGESMILETSELLRALAELYDVPELAWFSSEAFLPEAGSSHGVKRHFGFVHHAEGAPARPGDVLQAVIPEHPHGHELHLHRQDADYRLMIAAIRHGATVLQRTRIASVAFDDAGATVQPEVGGAFRARYVVDATGFRSVLATRHRRLTTHSRALFTHAMGLPDLAAVAPDSVPELPFPMHEGTLHHVFEGGWVWVIPFDNHARSTNPLCSVGVLLDPRRHPEQGTPAEEVASLCARFPTLAAQLGSLSAVRPWTRTGRLQYGSEKVVGDRWCLLGHAAGFVDPLFSKGLYLSMAAVATLADLLLDGLASDRLDRQAMLPLETLTQRFLAEQDALVHTAYTSFATPEAWRAASVLWLSGAYTELLALHGVRRRARGCRTAYRRGLSQLRLVGGGFEGFAALSAACQEALACGDAATASALLHATPWMPGPFRAVLHGATSLPRRKLRLDVLRPGGFLGEGAYRAHFFGDDGWPALVAHVLRDALAYHPLPLALLTAPSADGRLGPRCD